MRTSDGWNYSGLIQVAELDLLDGPVTPHESRTNPPFESRFVANLGSDGILG